MPAITKCLCWFSTPPQTSAFILAGPVASWDCLHGAFHARLPQITDYILSLVNPGHTQSKFSCLQTNIKASGGCPQGTSGTQQNQNSTSPATQMCISHALWTACTKCSCSLMCYDATQENTLYMLLHKEMRALVQDTGCHISKFGRCHAYCLFAWLLSCQM